MAGQRADDANEKPPAVDTDVSSPSAPSAPVDAAAALAVLRDFKLGTVIEGKYRIDKILGRGAMGVVAEATHLELAERVALKFLYAKNHATEEDFRTRFRREAKVSAKLRNEHITRVIDVGVWREQFPFMVMDLLEGSDLRDVIRASGTLSVPVALEYIIQICEGVAEAHAHGIVHRDLKPSNLFVTKRADGSDLVKILDFGISKWTAQEGELDELTQTGVVLGSPKYMSPEQLFGSANVDSRADVWSIGAIFYEMLAGKPPYDMATLTRICAELASDRPPPSLRVHNPDIAPELEAVIMRCFLRAPEERVQSVAELAGLALDAVGAPFASQMRVKIQAILDPKGTRDGLGSASGGLSFSSGGYGSLPISTTRIPVARGDATPIPTGTPTVTAPRDQAQSEPKRGPWLLIAVLVAIVALGALAFRSLSDDNAPRAERNAPPLPSGFASTTTTPIASAVAPPTSANAANASSASDLAASATPSASAPSVTRSPMGVGFVPRMPPKTTATATSEPTATTPPTPTPPPPATTQEPPKKKPNPLEDRQ